MNAERSAPRGAVFISYAREDAAAARRIAEALRAHGIEVWFDESELRGGDSWDAKIRQQIRECALFLPIISASTQARAEGYFRLEWKLADRRMDLIGKSKAFLVPVCIDDTRESAADVPDSFLSVQWTRLRAGDTPPRFCERVESLMRGSNVEPGRPRPGHRDEGVAAPGRPAAPATARSHARTWLAVAMGLGAAAALLIWRPWENRTHRDRTPSGGAPAAAKPAKVAELRARLNPMLLKKDDFPVWSAAIDRVIAADDQNAEAWALRSILNSLQVTRSYDAGTKPLEVGRAAAHRALLLDPSSALGELALALHHTAMISRGGDPLAARPHLERALPRLPKDALSNYANLTAAYQAYDFERAESAAKAWLASDPTAHQPAWTLGLVYLTLRRAAEALVWSEKSAGEPTATGARASVTVADTHFYLRGDLRAARVALDRIPAALGTDNRVLYARWLLAMAEGQFDLALQELARTPETNLSDRVYHGPKALLAALAHQAAGRPDVAAAQLREAEGVLRQLLAADSQNEELRAVLALTLASLGRKDEARSELAFVEPLARGRPRMLYSGQIMLLLAQTYGTLGQVEPLVYWLREMLSGPGSPPITPASLRLDPRFRNVIKLPEVQTLLGEYAHLNAETTTVKESAPPQKSIAVLAFKNLSAEKDNDVFSDGISDELTNVLGRVPGLRVAGSTSAFSFKGKDATHQEIGQKLGVTHIVEGTVRKANGRVRITAKLVNAADGFQVWASETYERPLHDVWGVQDEIVGLIAQNLQLRLGSAPRTSKVDPEAHRLLLEGRYFLALRDQGFAQAQKAFEAALALDPDFAEAHAGLAAVHVVRTTFQPVDRAFTEAQLRPGRESAHRAVKLAPSLVQAHAVLGYEALLSGRLDESEQHFQRGLAINPNDAFARHWHAHLLAHRGQLDLAIEENERAVRLDPLAFSMLTVYARHLTYARRHAEALEIARRALTLRPTYEWARVVEASNLLALGRTSDAVESARKALRDEAQLRWPEALAVRVLREARLEAEATRHGERLLAASPQGARPLVLAALGRFDEALSAQEKLPSDPFSAWHYYWSDLWAPVREDPRFHQRLAQLGLGEQYRVARATLERMLKSPPAAK